MLHQYILQTGFGQAAAYVEGCNFSAVLTNKQSQLGSFGDPVVLTSSPQPQLSEACKASFSTSTGMIMIFKF